MSYHDLAFTQNVLAIQSKLGSPIAKMSLAEDLSPMLLGTSEKEFIENSDGFFISSVSETGWPYIQFRGGTAGFARIIGDSTIAWAELRGNRQYITLGNLVGNDKVALFIIDYARRQRLKILGKARFTKDESILEILVPYADSGRIEGALVVSVEAYDWNCPDHITPRYTENEIGFELERLRNRVIELESELLKVKSSKTSTDCHKDFHEKT